MGIDTGKMTKALRAESATIRQKKAADWIGEHFAGVARTVSGVLQVVDAVHAVTGTRFMDVSSETLHRMTGKRVPRWNERMPAGISRIRREKVNADNPLTAANSDTSFLAERSITPEKYILAVARFVPEKGLHDQIGRASCRERV